MFSNNLEYPYDLINYKNKNSQNSEYEVIDFAEFKESGGRKYAYYIVKFDTGYTRTARRDCILRGEVKNKDIRTNLKSRINEQDFIGYKSSNKAGEEFEVVSFDGRIKGKLMYTVKFKESNTQKSFDKYSILKGSIKNPIHIEGFIGYKGTNNQGENFEVVSFANKGTGQTTYNVKFEYTGYIKEFFKHSILKGNIKDPYYPSIYGVACCGEAKTWDGNETCKEYYMWHGMINRCHNPKCQAYHMYGGIGIRVCDRWLCFENFKEDIKSLYNYDSWKQRPDLYSLDKDTLQRGIEDRYKVYSPETCMFISDLDNNLEQASRNSNNVTNLFGVFAQQSGNYYTKVGSDYYGTYSDPIVAANVYNQVAKLRSYPEKYLNNVEYIPIVECTKQRVNTVRMCHIVDNSQPRS